MYVVLHIILQIYSPQNTYISSFTTEKPLQGFACNDTTILYHFWNKPLTLKTDCVDIYPSKTAARPISGDTADGEK